VVEMKGKLETKWKVVGKDVTELEFVATGLKPDSEYEFRVAAVNKAGQGQASPPSKPSKYGKQSAVMRETMHCYCIQVNTITHAGR